ncbi:glycosyltransferase family 4 protein [Staphylococcus saprophyticus]|uniref:glycosyltransferase family 4 protein n=1 Tax=Staphylococcus saprophyticus TaxID=29385 RepID=UPI0019D0EA87|nr:glycosyltransferase family 4 protein [Staphylococcus saprophyticus]MBN6204695.1 glycosyltransferase family 4 protein [Staphylococcus saprophyticus]MDW4361310.1 glycosyltransferase family 4 protein [Staphylococcus saprophyticus]
MNVLHLNSNYLHSPLYSEMISKLEKLNIENTILMPRKINDNKHTSNNLIETNAEIEHSQFLKPSDRFFYFNKQKKIQKWIENLNINYENYDVIHAHTLFSDGYLAFKSNKPYVITVRNTDVNYYMKYYKHLNSLGRNILNNANAVIFLSTTYKEKTINKLYKNNEDIKKIEDKSYTVPNGINQYWIDNKVEEKKQIFNDINFLFIGRIMKNKNIEFLAKNLNEKYFSKNIKIYIIGDILDENYFNKLKKYKNLIFLGSKSKEEISGIMKEMHIFSLVSHHESFGLVYLEAITQNLPVLYTRNEGFDKYFVDGVVGYSVNSKNGIDLIKKTNAILENYSQIQNNLNGLNKEAFSWEQNANYHKGIYLRIIKGKPCYL